METHKRSIEEFASILQASTIYGLNRDGVACAVNITLAQTRIVEGLKYDKVDVGGSAKYMVEISTSIIYGVRGYGKIHKGHSYGTLSTIHLWDWAHYTAHSISREALNFSRNQEVMGVRR